MSALSDLLKKNNKSKFPTVAAAAVTATVVAFSFAKLATDEPNDSAAETSVAQSNSSGSAAFASNNLTIRPSANNSASSSPGGSGSSASMTGGSDGIISDDALEDFIPPEGIVARDGKGNVIYKRCRKLTEGQVTAKAEMEKEQARYSKFDTAAKKYLSSGGGGGGDAGYTVNNCAVSGKKVPKESPCPTYQEYMARRDFFSQQYYEMSNQLQRNASLDEQCKGPRDLVMAAADPNWRSDRSIASETPSSALQQIKGTR